jgi:multiple sugar transport system permease protein
MKRAGYRAKLQRWGYLFCSPFLLGFCVFSLWPVLYTVTLSFSNLRGLRPVSQFIGFTNFAKLIKDRFFWGSMGNTFIISFVSIVLQIAVSLVLAIILSDAYLKIKGKGLFRAIVYLPNLLSPVSVALLFRSLFLYPTGPLNRLLFNLGFHSTVVRDGVPIPEMIDLFRSVFFTRGLIAYIYWVMWYGYQMILIMAGITGISFSLFESARVDGANGRQTTWYITLPLLRPIMLFIFLTCMIGGFNIFDIPAMLTEMRGNPDFKARTVLLYLYNIAFQGSHDYSYGAAIAMGMFIVTLIFAFIIFFFLQDRSELKKKRAT